MLFLLVYIFFMFMNFEIKKKIKKERYIRDRQSIISFKYPTSHLIIPQELMKLF